MGNEQTSVDVSLYDHSIPKSVPCMPGKHELFIWKAGGVHPGKYSALSKSPMQDLQIGQVETRSLARGKGSLSFHSKPKCQHTFLTPPMTIHWMHQDPGTANACVVIMALGKTPVFLLVYLNSIVYIRRIHSIRHVSVHIVYLCIAYLYMTRVATMMC